MSNDMSQLMNGLANNGPWAIMFGWLLWQVMKAWTQDRAQIAPALDKVAEALTLMQFEIRELRTAREKEGSKV